MALQPPEVGPTLTDYERVREDNIRRNEVLVASLRRKADELSAACVPAKRGRGRPRKRATESNLSAASIQTSIPKRGRGRPPKSEQQQRPPRPAPIIPVGVRRSTRSSGASAAPWKNPPRSTCLSSSLASSILAAAAASPPHRTLAADSDAGRGLVLRMDCVRRVVPKRIMAVRVLPLVDRTVVVAGDELGHVGFWDADGLVEDKGGPARKVFEYLPHGGPVGAIAAHPSSLQKVYSSSCNGEICLMDLEKESFSIIQEYGCPVHSLCQAPNGASCIYFGDSLGQLKLFDERMGKVSTTWKSHDSTINSIDFHPENTHMVATGSNDGTACIWDLRRMEQESLKVLDHVGSVQSAYFSPSGRMVATTSLDDTVRIFSVEDFDNSHIFKHNNSQSVAIWGWNDTDLFIGNRKTAIDIISIDASDSRLSASSSACLESEYMVARPRGLSAHTYKVGHLACATSRGKVSLWTRPWISNGC